MLVHDRPERHGRGGRRSWPGKRSRPELNLGCGRPVGQRGVGAKGVVGATPALEDDLGLLERREDLAVEQLVAELTSVTPIDRSASATVRPCAVSTSTCRSFATISSWLRAIPQGGPLLRGQTSLAGCAHPTSSAGQAARGEKANAELTSNPDHPMGADHDVCDSVNVSLLERPAVVFENQTQ